MKKIQKGGDTMGVGRPKLEISRFKQLNIRVTAAEFEEIENLAKKLKISKSEVILRGIKLLKNPPRQIITRSQMPNFVPKKIPKHSEGIIAED